MEVEVNIVWGYEGVGVWFKYENGEDDEVWVWEGEELESGESVVGEEGV